MYHSSWFLGKKKDVQDPLHCQETSKNEAKKGSPKAEVAQSCCKAKRETKPGVRLWGGLQRFYIKVKGGA